MPPHKNPNAKPVDQPVIPGPKGSGTRIAGVKTVTGKNKLGLTVTRTIAPKSAGKGGTK